MSQTHTIPAQLKVHHAEGAKQKYEVMQQEGKANAYLIHDVVANAPVAFMEGELPKGTIFEAYASKGGDLGVIHQENGLVYFLLPGATARGQGFKISMAGETLPAVTQQNQPPMAKQSTQMVTTQAMILGAGLGTRILPLTEEYLGVAKPALPWLGENTVIGALVELLAKQGIKNIYVNTFYQRESVQRALNEACATHNMQWFEIPEARATGTAGGVLHILNNADQFPTFKTNEPLLVLQGDAVSNADLAQLINIHTEQQAIATIGCQIVCDEDVNKFGIIATTSPENPTCGEVATFLEKPSLQQAGPHRLASTGFYVLSPELFPHLQAWYANRLQEEQAAAKAISADVPTSVKEFDFAKDVFNMCLDAKLKLYAQEVEGFWCDIGNPAQYLETIAMAYRGELNQAMPENLSDYYNDQGAFYWPGTKALVDQAGITVANGVVVAKKQ